MKINPFSTFQVPWHRMRAQSPPREGQEGCWGGVSALCVYLSPEVIVSLSVETVSRYFSVNLFRTDPVPGWVLWSSARSPSFLCCFFPGLTRNIVLLWWEVFISTNLLAFRYLSGILKFIIFPCFQRSWSHFLRPSASLGRGLWGWHQFWRPRAGDGDGMERASFFRGTSHSCSHATHVMSRDEII